MQIGVNPWWRQYFDPDVGRSVRLPMAAGFAAAAIGGFVLGGGAAWGWGLTSGVGWAVFLIGMGVMLLGVLPPAFFVVYGGEIRRHAESGAAVRSAGEAGWAVEFSGLGFRRYALTYQVLLATPFLVISAGAVTAGLVQTDELADPRTSAIGWIGVGMVVGCAVWVGSAFGRRDLVLVVGSGGIGLVAVDKAGQVVAKTELSWSAIRAVRGGYEPNGLHSRYPSVTLTIRPDSSVARVIGKIGYGARLDRFSGELVLDPRVLAANPNVVMLVLEQFAGRAEGGDPVTRCEASQMLQVPSLCVQRAVDPLV